jgi:hypothetical protein
LSDKDFRSLTLRQFQALLHRHKRAVEVGNLRAGVIAATSANFSMGKDPNKPPLTPWDFFSNLPRQSIDDMPEMTEEQTLEYLKQVFLPQRPN